MHRLKRLYSSLMVLAIISKCTDSSEYRHRRQFANVTGSSGEVEVVPPYWEDMLREFIFKTISPSPPANNLLYKRILEAPFYGGPFPTLSGNETTVTLSRGNVFYFPSEQWILCQEGCVDCDACAEQRSPTVKWILRRIKRHSSFVLPRYDLQLTIVPQEDGTFHMKNLWPRSYVYVTPHADKQQSRSFGLSGYSDWERVFPYDNGSVVHESHNKPARRWRLVERDVENDKQDAKEGNFTLPNVLSNSSSIGVGKQDSLIEDLGHLSEQKLKPENMQEGIPSRLTTEVPLTKSLTSYHDAFNIDSNGFNEAEQFTPKLILGTDYSGRKHVVHIIPAEDLSELTSTNVNSRSNNPLLPKTNVGSNPQFNNTLQNQDNQTLYDKFLRRIFVSLNNHKSSIEKFLQSRKNNAVEDEQTSSTSQTVSVQSVEPELLPSTITVPTSLQNIIHKKERFNSDDTVAHPPPALVTREEGKHNQDINTRDEIMLFSKDNVVNNHEAQYQNYTRAVPHARKPTNSLKRIRQRRYRQRGNDFGGTNVDRFVNKTATAPRNNIEVKSTLSEQKDDNQSASYQQAGQGETLAHVDRKSTDGSFLRSAGNYRKEANGHLQKFDGPPNDNNLRNRPRRVRIDPLRSPIMERIRGGTNFDETYRANLPNNFTKSNSPPNVRADFLRN